MDDDLHAYFANLGVGAYEEEDEDPELAAAFGSGIVPVIGPIGAQHQADSPRQEMFEEVLPPETTSYIRDEERAWRNNNRYKEQIDEVVFNEDLELSDKLARLRDFEAEVHRTRVRIGIQQAHFTKYDETKVMQPDISFDGTMADEHIEKMRGETRNNRREMKMVLLTLDTYLDGIDQRIRAAKLKCEIEAEMYAHPTMINLASTVFSVPAQITDPDRVPALRGVPAPRFAGRPRPRPQVGCPKGRDALLCRDAAADLRSGSGTRKRQGRRHNKYV